MTSDFYQPTDIDLLRMENDLLAHENRFLKARLHDVGQDNATAGANGEHSGSAPAASREKVVAAEPERSAAHVENAVAVVSADTQTVPVATMERLRQAERDIKSVVNSVQRRRFVRLLLNRRRGYRTLLQRYGNAQKGRRRR
jgi:hypothetical protein